MSESRVAKTIRQYANYDDNNPGRHNLISWSNEIERLEAENAKLLAANAKLRNGIEEWRDLLSTTAPLRIQEHIVEKIDELLKGEA